MGYATLGLFVIATESSSPKEIKESLRVLDCSLPIPNFRMSHGTNDVLFWWNLKVRDLTGFRRKIAQYETGYVDRSVFVVDYALTKDSHQCC